MKYIYLQGLSCMRRVFIYCFLTISFLFSTDIFAQNTTIAHDWNEVLLESIRKDFARPTIHARNLWHSSAMMYDIWALTDDSAQPYFIGNVVDGFDFPFNSFTWDDDPSDQLNEAISYAMYRLLAHRFSNSPEGFNAILRLNNKMTELGYNISYTNSNYANGEPAALGNYISELIIEYGLQDGANETMSYGNQFYTPVNDPLVMAFSGNPNIEYPNRWQQLTLDVFIDQSGNQIPFNTPDFLSPEWGEVTNFAIPEDKKTVATRDGETFTFFHDPGSPPLIDTLDNSASEDYKKGFEMVVQWSSHLDPSDGVMIDISPASLGNPGALPDEEDYYSYYDYFEGGDPSMGHASNPITGQPYEPQLVPRGDYTRVLAEFWADGPDSETPPGHWFTLINYVNSHPLLEKRYEGIGPIIDDLEWDLKSYFLLGAAMHDSAISTWGIKGYYDYLRPISAVRYMADKGQSTDPNRPNYNPAGLDLIDGSIELVAAGDPLAGDQGQHIDKIKVKAWKGPDYINFPETDVAGVDWILAENWWPYQRPSFVTPPFAGYVSGHSTFSRAAAEIITMLTGDEFFPGGMGTFEVEMNEFLVFEDGPSQDFTLQWATYRDASDQTSLSRIWGGIHPPADDIPGRLIGIEVANDVYAKAESLFFTDFDEDGYWAYEDCNDEDASVYPGATEVCDGLDNNCDGTMDNTVPTIMCPSDVTVNSDLGICGAVVNYMVSTTNVCDPESLVQVAGQASGSVFPIGSTTNTFSITDASGSMTTCSMDIVVVDNEPPTVQGQSISIELDGNGNVSITPEQINNNSSDNCGIMALALDVSEFSCDNLGANTVILTATDESGNTGMSTSAVTVEDNVLPTAMSRDITLTLDEAGQVSIEASEIDDGSSDNCENMALAIDVSEFTCDNLGTNTVSLTVTDESGNSAMSTSEVTVEDNTLPTAMSKYITVSLDEAGQVSIEASEIDDGSSDNCKNMALAIDVSEFTCDNLGTNPVILTVTDESGNSAMSTSVVTVEDNALPTAMSKDITVSLDEAGQVSIEALEVDNGSFDNCGIMTLALDLSEFSCDNLGANTVILTVTDESGNSAMSTLEVTVEDNTLPTAMSKDVTVSLDEAGQVSIEASEVDNGSIDNCGIMNMALDLSEFSCDNLGANTVILTVTDESGNSTMSTSFVTVEDNISPTAMSQDITVSLDESGQVSIEASDIDNGSFDNCGIMTLALDVSEFSCDNLGANTVILTVTDESGNSGMSTSFVTVEDNTLPTAMSKDITVSLDEAGQVSIEALEADNGSFDNCGIMSLALDVSEFSCDNLGANTVILTATDESGNTGMSTSVVTVEDNVLPTAMSKDITLALDEAGQVSIEASEIDDGSSDNCENMALAIDVSEFTCDNLGTNTVILTVTDESGNSAMSTSEVTVEDNTLPTAMSKDITVSLDEAGQVSIEALEVDNGSFDNCGIMSLALDLSEFTCENLGANAVILTVTDESGNSGMSTSVVTVEDNDSPTAMSQDITVSLDESGQVSIEASEVDNGSIDNCGIMALAIDVSEFSCDNLGANAVILTVTDESGNSGMSTSVVTVEDNDSPTAMSQDVTVSLDESGLVSIEASEVDNGSSDNCGSLVMALDISEFSCDNLGSNTVIFTVTDESGNSSTSNASVTIFDDMGPVIDCITDIEVALETGECSEIVMFEIPFTDNCESISIPTIEQTAGLPSGSYYPIGTTTNTFIVTDANGNSTECTFDVTLIEFDNGVTGTLTCNDNLNVSLDSNCEVNLNADMLLEGSAYGCYDHFEISVSGGATGNIITQPGTYTVTVTDPNTGNSCWSTINVEDKNAPVLDCACPVGGTPIELPFTGTLDANSPIWTRPFVGGAGCNPSGVGIDIPYMTHNFAISMDNNVTAEQVTFTAPSADGFLALYADSFDPADPCGNLVITNDDGGVGFLAQFTAMLESGTQYILVVTTFNENGNDYGDYVVEMTSDAEFLELEEECNFRCVDVDYVMNSTDLTPMPDVTSCDEYDLVFSDQLTTDANGQQIILRTWVARNGNGSATCTSQYNFAALTISDLTLPTSPLELSCNDGTSPDEIVALLDNPLTTDNPNTAYIENNEGFVHAYPTYLVNGHPQKVDNNVCDIYAAYTDQELDACEEGCNGNRKVIRTWTLVDWSTLETTTYTQTIKAVDSEAPTLNTQDIAVSTDAWGCVATFVVPTPWELHDNCDSAPRYYVTGPAGVTITGSFEEGFTATGAPKGTHTFNYVAYDCCGNEASFPFEVTVSDITPPVVISKQNIVVSLTSAATSVDGYAKLYAESVDNGSYDGCSDEVKLEIRRDTDNCDVKGNMTYNADNHPQDGNPNPLASNYDPDGGEFVKFCCTDLTTATVDVDGDGTNDAGYVRVWLRVWDDGDMDGTFGSDGDNYNESWSYVKVEDKLAPQITCPADVTINCNDDYLDLTTTGEATGYGSCGGVPVEYKDVLVSLNTCNEGFVRRRWNIVGRTDIFCDQTITLEGIDAPVNVSFSAVGDKEFDCLDGISVGEPTWTAGPCDILGYTVATDTFRFEDGACYKLVNTYTVINWCDYDPNSGSTEGMWEHIQVIKIVDSTVPTIENCEDAMYAINDHADEDGDGEVCEAKLVLTNVAMDPGSDNCPTAWLKWTVEVDLWADGTPDYEYTSFIPGSSFNFNQFNTDANGNGIPDAYIKPTASGQEVSIPLVDIAGSMSNHKVKWTVTDGCNNFSSCSNDFMVVDKKAPTPYCIDISSAVMESSGTVELWAIDFNVGSFDNCTAIEDLRYTFTDVSPEDDANYDFVQRSSSKEFTCEDVEYSPLEVNMYVWDEKGNADFCKVFLTLVDNSEDCAVEKVIAGQITTESGERVNEVEATLKSALPEYPRTEMTDMSGMYLFGESPLNADFEITASKDVDYLNGVSTLDLVKIQRHILGLESFDSPYKLVAADINADNEIKVNDLNQLRKLILGVIVDLPTNESWRFVDGAQALDMDIDLADVNYEINIANFAGDMTNNDLVAVKVGDVTENATANLQTSNIEVRSNKTLDLMIDNKEVEAGELVEVSFTSENFADVYGYQFTMELNGLEFTGVTQGVIAMTESNVGVLNSDVVTMSYHSAKATTATNTENIFTVSFRATEAGQISDMIAVSSKVTASEAYVSTSLNTGVGETLEIREVVISTRGEVASVATNELYQNEPNPFKVETVIGFALAEAGAVEFTVTDAAGRVVMNIETVGERGYNMLSIDANDLGSNGLYYYTVKSGEFNATKKLIIIR